MHFLNMHLLFYMPNRRFLLLLFSCDCYLVVSLARTHRASIRQSAKAWVAEIYSFTIVVLRWSARSRLSSHDQWMSVVHD